MTPILMALGFTGQALFSSRFLVQWIASERQGRSVVPPVFWYLSLAGGALLFCYAVARRDPVFIVGQSAGLVVYARNLILLERSPSPAHGKGGHAGSRVPEA